MCLGAAEYFVLCVQRTGGRRPLRGRAAPGAVSGMRHRVESGAQVPRDAFGNAGGGADSEPAGGIADAAAGSAGNDAAGRILAAWDFLAGDVAAADSDRAGA